MRVDVGFRSPDGLLPGTYQEEVLIDVCYDASCRWPLIGSPVSGSLIYTVEADAQPETGFPPLPVLSRIPLEHDVVAAQYSASLGAMIMVSNQPRNALFVLDIDTGVQTELPLDRVPVALSLSPDGLEAAVGHDRALTHVDLATVGQPGAPAPRQINTTCDVSGLVLDGRGYVHIFPATSQWVSVHSVELATGIEQLGSGSLRAGSRISRHPDGTAVYTANVGLSPEDIARFDISGFPGRLAYDSPYHGAYSMCGNVWVDARGARLYTACGNIFRSSTVVSEDMTYTGALQLSSAQRTFMISAASSSAVTGEVALIEIDPDHCQSGWVVSGNPNRCRSRLSFHDGDTLNVTARYALPPLPHDGDNYLQRALFVFHSADGAQRYLISRLDAAPSLVTEYYFSVVGP
jgi:hypothetical protein